MNWLRFEMAKKIVKMFRVDLSDIQGLQRNVNFSGGNREWFGKEVSSFKE